MSSNAFASAFSEQPAAALRPLRTMHLVPQLGAGGMENGVVNLCNGIAVERFCASICVLEAGGALEARVDRGRVELLEVRRRFGKDPRVPVRLATELRRRRIDILHTHSWGTLVEGFVAAKLAGVPVVVHGEHGTMETRRRNIYVQRVLWYALDRVVVVCDSLRGILAKTIGFPRNCIQVIPNGVDTELFRPANLPRDDLRRQFGLPPHGLLVGMVARLIPLKDHAGVIQAMARLREAGIEAHLALAGDGPLRAELTQLGGQLHIPDRVHFLGEIAQVAPFLNALDVFVLNSHREGMSNTVLEAMACGLPVVATAVGANPELLADGAAGLLIPPQDTNALFRAICRLAGEPELRSRLGQAARERAETQFSISSMVQAYSQLYLQMCRSRR